MSGSSRGKALGNQFLKHLTRARLVFLMLDAFQNDFDPVAGYNELLEEIKAFNPEFVNIPRFLVISKMDAPEAGKVREKKKINVPCPVFKISAETGLGVDALMQEAEKKILASAAAT